MNPNSSIRNTHPLQREIKYWTRQQYFYQWFFSQTKLKNKKKNINRFIDDKDFLINFSGLDSETYIKYRLQMKLDEQKKILKAL